MKKKGLIVLIAFGLILALYVYSSALIDPVKALRGLALIIETSEKQEASAFKNVRSRDQVRQEATAKPVNTYAQEMKVSGAVAILTSEE